MCISRNAEWDLIYTSEGLITKLSFITTLKYKSNSPEGKVYYYYDYDYDYYCYYDDYGYHRHYKYTDLPTYLPTKDHLAK